MTVSCPWGRFLRRALLPAILVVLAHLATIASAMAQPSPTAIIGRIRSTGDRPIDFHAATFPDTVYVGQQVTYQVAVLLSDQARSRLRRNPEFLPPELRGLLSYELGAPSRVPARSFGGALTYEAHVFQRAMFAVSAGTLRVPSPQLTYSLPQSSSYFSREERFVVRAESAQLVVVPLPAEGRPADFTGAVGVLRASTRFDGAAARVGDPLLLTVRVEGVGNVRLLPRPVIEVPWASIVTGSERVQMDTSGALVRGWKEFDFLLTPARDGPVTIPVFRYPYFDPYRAQYAIAETQPADVRVAGGTLAMASASDDQERLPLRVWRRRAPRQVRTLEPALTTGVLVVLALAPLPAFWALVRRTRRRSAHGDAVASSSPTRTLAPLDDPTPAGVARRVRRTLLATLAERLHVPPADVVSRADLERVLRRRGVTRATTREVLTLVDELAQRGFGGEGPEGEGDVDARARVALDRVNAEAVSHGRTRLWGRRTRRAGMLLLGTMTLGTADARRAQAQTADATPLTLMVGEGVAAYNARRFPAAAERFAEAVSTSPRDVDLLVNWGTAAWAAGDTVSAVIAWQRAARLDPLAADIQRGLAMLPSGARSGLADVPMIPVFALTVLACVAWCAAWGTLFVAWRRVPTGATAPVAAVLLLTLAVAAAGTAWWGDRALDATGLAVVRRPETVRTAPAFNASTSGGVSTGDIVRASMVQEGWVRIALGDGRDGWLPATRLAPLVGAADTR